MTRQRLRSLLGKLAFFPLALLIVVWSVGLFLWKAITSIKPNRDLATLPPILPTEITFSHYFALFRIILPLSAPGLFTTASLIFSAAWNEFLFALTSTTSIDYQTIPVGIALVPAMYHVPWGNSAAASTLVILPLVVLVLILQRWIVRGIVAGAFEG